MELYHDGDLVYAGRGIYVKWETIQCVLGALSEILVRITAYQLAYLEAPDTEHCNVMQKSQIKIKIEFYS